MEITLRSVREADNPFLFQLYASAREPELSQVPWTAAQKQMFLEMQFAAQMRGYAERRPHATHEILCVDGRAVGRLYLDRSGATFHILDITIAPRDRNAGIGSAVLTGLLEEANRSQKAVSIYVESFNPSRRLFERVGFQAASVDGFLILLERPPGDL